MAGTHLSILWTPILAAVVLKFLYMWCLCSSGTIRFGAVVVVGEEEV